MTKTVWIIILSILAAGGIGTAIIFIMKHNKADKAVKALTPKVPVKTPVNPAVVAASDTAAGQAAVQRFSIAN